MQLKEKKFEAELYTIMFIITPISFMLLFGNTYSVNYILLFNAICFFVISLVYLINWIIRKWEDSKGKRL